MRILAFIAAAVTVLGIVFAVSGSGAVQDCTKQGTPGRDVLAGTPRRDVICAKGGRDYIAGGRGADLLRGDAGRDTIVGGKGSDRLVGSSGRDRLFAVDGVGGDRLDGGAGRDQCFADPTDRVRGCERIFRGVSLKETEALSSAFLGQGILAESLIGTTTVPPAVETVTVTVTHTASFPPCTPPPDQSPAPC